MPNQKTRYKEFTPWDWEVTVAALRYYECGRTIASAMFPAEFVQRFFTGDYDPAICGRLAHQYANTDHGIRKERDFQKFDEETRTWYVPHNSEPWLVLYTFLDAYANGKFHMLTTKYKDKHGKDTVGVKKAFYCEALNKWYGVEKYLVEPYLFWEVVPECICDIGVAVRFDEE